MTQNTQRPLSPHIQIYRWQLTSVLSIFHRLSGVALAVSLVFCIVGFSTAAYSKDCFAAFHDFASMPLIKLGLFLGWSAWIYHLLNGLRHLMWDAGYGYDLKTTYATGWGVVGLTFILAFLGWGMLP